jgi:hypothetical protein
MTNTFTAKYKGEIAGRHSSARPFTHALIVLVDEKPHRRDAYATEPGDDDRESFAQWAHRALKQPGDPWRLGTRKNSITLTHNATDIDEAKRKVEGGLDAWFARERDERIKYFEKQKAEGYFKPKVWKWVRAEHIAKWTESWQVGQFFELLAVVPVETETSLSVARRFAELPRDMQREILTDVCESMINAKAWDEIAGLLVAGHRYVPPDADEVKTLVVGQFAILPRPLS